jgi:hypothetical protein
MQLGLQAVTTSLGHRIQGTLIDIQTTEALVETMWHGLKSNVAGVMDDFTKGLNVMKCVRNTAKRSPGLSSTGSVRQYWN